MPGAKILLVDDDNDYREVMHRILERAGYFVLEADNGRQALTILDRFQPDLVLVDVDMPVMSGRQFVEELDKRWETRPFGMVTISGSVHAHSSPTQWFLPKPFEVSLLLTLVTNFCGERALSPFWPRPREQMRGRLEASPPV
jgi:CheY-like chemotaxis protein